MKLMIASAIALLCSCKDSQVSSKSSEIQPSSRAASAEPDGPRVFAMDRVQGVRMAMTVGSGPPTFIRVDGVWACEGTTCVRDDAALLCSACAGPGCDCTRPVCAPVCSPYGVHAAQLAKVVTSPSAAMPVPEPGPAPAKPIPPFGVFSDGGVTLVSLPTSGGKHVFMQVGGAWTCAGESCAPVSLYGRGCDCRLEICSPVCRPKELAAVKLPRLGEIDPPR